MQTVEPIRGRVPEWGRRNGLGETLSRAVAAALLSPPAKLSPKLVLCDFRKWDAEFEVVMERAAAHPGGLHGLINDALAAKAAAKKAA